MKLEQIWLKNYRCFERLKIKLHPELTVIVAENGAGKTAILDAIAIGLGRYLTKIPGIAGTSTKETDLRVSDGENRAPFLMLAWRARTRDGEVLTWSGGRKRNTAVKTSVIQNSLDSEELELLSFGSKQIFNYTVGLVEAVEAETASYLPVIAYYGTNRAIRDEIQRRRGFKKNFTRFDALAGALEPDSRFRAAFEWFNAMEDLERRKKESLRDFDYRLPELQVVRDAITRMLSSGYTNPRTEIRPLRFVIDKKLQDNTVRTLRISQLSDGFRVILGVVMDLARRLAQANCGQIHKDNCVENPLDLPAIALIDEVDLHLHPSWQQRVLTDLRNTFRGTQFIVTTHSPQVLSTVPSESIRIITQQWNPEADIDESIVVTPQQQTEGTASADILATVMSTDPTPDVESARQLSEYRVLIQEGLEESDRGVWLNNTLIRHYGNHHPLILECERLIRLQAFKRQLPKTR